MSRDANQGSESQPGMEEVDSQASDFEDSLLQQVIQIDPPSRFPGPGERFGGPGAPATRCSNR